MFHDCFMTSSTHTALGTQTALPVPHQTAAANPGMQLISPDGVKYALLGLFAVLLTMHSAALFVAYGLGYDVAMGFVPAFHMDWERNVPTYASTILLLSCGILAVLQPRLRAADARSALAWNAIAVAFVLLSADEAFRLHELVSDLVKSSLTSDWVPMFAWVVPYGLALLILTGIFLPWFARLDRSSQVRFALAAALYIGGALGMELVSSFYFESLDPDREKFRTLTGGLLGTVEESLELIGVSVFLHALVRRLGGFSVSAKAG